MGAPPADKPPSKPQAQQQIMCMQASVVKLTGFGIPFPVNFFSQPSPKQARVVTMAFEVTMTPSTGLKTLSNFGWSAYSLKAACTNLDFAFSQPRNSVSYSTFKSPWSLEGVGGPTPSSALQPPHCSITL